MAKWQTSLSSVIKFLNYLVHLSTNYVFDVSYSCRTDDFFHERDKSQFTKKTHVYWNDSNVVIMHVDAEMQMQKVKISSLDYKIRKFIYLCMY